MLDIERAAPRPQNYQKYRRERARALAANEVPVDGAVATTQDKANKVKGRLLCVTARRAEAELTA